MTGVVRCCPLEHAPGVPQPAELGGVARCYGLVLCMASTRAPMRLASAAISSSGSARMPRSELLLLVGHPGWEWGDVPVDVSVSGLAAEAHQGVPEQGVVPGEEGDGIVVGPYEVAWVVGVAGERPRRARSWWRAGCWSQPRPTMPRPPGRAARRWRSRPAGTGASRRESGVRPGSRLVWLPSMPRRPV